MLIIFIFSIRTIVYGGGFYPQAYYYKMLGNAIAKEEFNLIPDTQFSEQIKTEKLIFWGAPQSRFFQ
jgi:hypothetical protein